MKYIRRLVWFLASKVLLITVIAALLIVGFYMAMNTSNILILITDGMSARVDTVLKSDDSQALNVYFSDAFLSYDPVLTTYYSGNSAYDNYSVTGYDHSVNLNWLWSWPWSDTAQAEISETVFGIEGSALSSKQEYVKAGLISKAPPKWQGGRYSVRLTRVSGRWKIDSMALLNEIVELDPSPAPAQTDAPTGSAG